MERRMNLFGLYKRMDAVRRIYFKLPPKERKTFFSDAIKNPEHQRDSDRTFESVSVPPEVVLKHLGKRAWSLIDRHGLDVSCHGAEGEEPLFGISFYKDYGGHEFEMMLHDDGALDVRSSASGKTKDQALSPGMQLYKQIHGKKPPRAESISGIPPEFSPPRGLREAYLSFLPKEALLSDDPTVFNKARKNFEKTFGAVDGFLNEPHIRDALRKTYLPREEK